MDLAILYREAHTPNSGLKEAHEIEWVYDTGDDDDPPTLIDRKPGE